MPWRPQVAGYATESSISDDRLMTAMTDAGYREVITYSFVDPALQRQLFSGGRGAGGWRMQSPRI